MFKENIDIRIEMLKLGLNNKDLARYIGVSDRTIVRWLSKELDDVKRAKIQLALDTHRVITETEGD